MVEKDVKGVLDVRGCLLNQESWIEPKTNSFMVDDNRKQLLIQ